MSQLSTIEWTDATWSPVVGCTRVSAGCDNCYAVRQTRRLEAMGQAKYAGLVNPGKGHFNGVARLHAPSLDWPLRWRGARSAKAVLRPSRIFVNPMSDLFHEALSDEEIAAVFGVMAACPQHTFQVLTKRPERMKEWIAWATRDETPGYEIFTALIQNGVAVEDHELDFPLENVWLGTSVEDQATADERIPHLLATPAAVRFVSYEPALRRVNFAPWLTKKFQAGWDAIAARFPKMVPPPAHLGRPADGPDWLIVGGESGPGARPFDIAWARSAIAQCREAGVACFLKQLGAYAILDPRYDRRLAGWTRKLRSRKGGDMSEWPEDLMVREFPA